MNQQNNDFHNNSYYSYQQPQGGTPNNNQNMPQDVNTEECEKSGSTSMILGIISLCLNFFCCGFVVASPILAIISLVYASKAKKASAGGNTYGGKGVAGLICSIISLMYSAIFICFIILNIFLGFFVMDFLDTVMNSIAFIFRL